MTTNETIARWLGLELKAYHPPSNRYGDYIIDGNNMHGMGYDTIFRVGDRALIGWYPDSDITLWHGEKGLLGEIERRGLQEKFLLRVDFDLGPMEIRRDNWREETTKVFWQMLRITPAQLAAALVEVIGTK